jgi:hypothetical protein
MRQSPEVMLKDPVDDMDMVEDLQQNRAILRVQPVEILADHVVEAAIGPLFVANKL